MTEGDDAMHRLHSALFIRDIRYPSSWWRGGFRSVTGEEIDAKLDAGQCQILSKTSNEHADAYVLSESSLFVYSHKVVIKTCGTTTLLLMLPFIKKYADSLDMDIEWVSFSRKIYTFLDEQKYPHTSFQTEVRFLYSMVGVSGDPLHLGQRRRTIVSDHTPVVDKLICDTRTPEHRAAGSRIGRPRNKYDTIELCHERILRVLVVVALDQDITSALNVERRLTDVVKP